MNEHKSEQKMKKSEQDEDERDGNVGLASHKTLTLLSTRTIVDGEHSACWNGNERVQNQNQN